MKNVLSLLSMLSASIIAQTNSWEDKFMAAMNDPKGVSILVEIQQKQFETNSTQNGTIEIFTDDHYLLDTATETVHVAGDKIQTWNKVTNQLIIDQIMEGDINIFNLITGDFKNVVFGPPIVGKNLVAMDYEIPTMGYSGKMTILKNGQPKNIKIKYGPNQSVDLIVSSYTKGKLVLYHTFSPRSVEVIDIRE